MLRRIIIYLMHKRDSFNWLNAEIAVYLLIVGTYESIEFIGDRSCGQFNS